MSNLIAQLAPKQERAETKTFTEVDAGRAPNIPDKVDTEPPFSIYERIKGHPYSIEHFGLDKYLEVDDELDINDFKGKARDIDGWISNRIAEAKLEDTIESYKTFIERYKSELGIAKTLKSEEKVERIHKYIQLLKKQDKLDKRRRELLDGFRNK